MLDSKKTRWLPRFAVSTATRSNRRCIGAALITVLLIASSLTSAHAQTRTQHEKLISVMNVINMYLLDGLSSFVLELGKIEPESVTITRSFQASFQNTGPVSYTHLTLPTTGSV